MEGRFRAEIVEENGLPPSALLLNHKFKKGDRVYLPSVYVDLDTYRMPLRSFGRMCRRYGIETPHARRQRRRVEARGAAS